MRRAVRRLIFFDFSTSIDASSWSNGAAEGIRTPDPRITNALLYQLSYRGTRALYYGEDGRFSRVRRNASPRGRAGGQSGAAGVGWDRLSR